jgi:hypothetical protein
MKRLAVILLVLASLVALGGCSAVSALFNTENALRNAGYQSVGVNTSFSGSDSTVNVSVTVQAPPSQSTTVDVAHIVWQNFHERFDVLHITVHGTGSSVAQDYTFDQVQAMFGPRNPAWNKTSVRSAYTDVGLEILVGVVVLALIVVTIVVLTTRRNRRRAFAGWPGAPPWSPQGPPPWSPQGPGGGAYGPGGGVYGPPPGAGPPGPPPGAGPPGAGPPGPGPSQGGGYPLWEPPSHPPVPPAPPPPPESTEGGSGQPSAD